MARARLILPARSGQFKSADASGNNAIVIVEERSSSYYRVFNSGQKSFYVVLGAQSIPLAAGSSIDVFGDDGISITATANEAISGIYEHLDLNGSANSNRSGRFAASGNTDKVKIIDLGRGGPKDPVYYRLFNSGEHPIEVRFTATETDPRFKLQKGTSRDFTPGAKPTGSSVRQVFVSATANDKPISGSYDVIGVD